MPLLQQTDSISTYVVSVFSNHSLPVINPEPLLRGANTNYWPTIILFFAFTIYVYLNFINPKKLFQVFTSIYSNQTSKQLYREDYRIGKSMSVLLSLSFLLIISYLTYIINKDFELILKGVSSINQYLFFLVVIISMYSVKFLFNYFLSVATLKTELNGEYTFNVFISGQTLGVILLPFAICIQFSKYPTEWFLYPAIVICALFYVLRSSRGFIISVIEQNIGIVYIFLYFCALEILPLLVLIKFLLVNF